MARAMAANEDQEVRGWGGGGCVPPAAILGLGHPRPCGHPEAGVGRRRRKGLGGVLVGNAVLCPPRRWSWRRCAPSMKATAASGSSAPCPSSTG